jgi:hypothetical protein
MPNGMLCIAIPMANASPHAWRKIENNGQKIGSPALCNHVASIWQLPASCEILGLQLLVIQRLLVNCTVAPDTDQPGTGNPGMDSH